MAVANTLAYYDTTIIVAGKKFLQQSPCGMFIVLIAGIL
jgi:hypothetical protein